MLADLPKAWARVLRPRLQHSQRRQSGRERAAMKRPVFAPKFASSRPIWRPARDYDRTESLKQLTSPTMLSLLVNSGSVSGSDPRPRTCAVCGGLPPAPRHSSWMVATDPRPTNPPKRFCCIHQCLAVIGMRIQGCIAYKV